MNIFWLDYDMEKNVTYYCDKHVVKMILEYAQLLSTVCRLNGVEEGYKASHINHPCSIWCRESLDNWLLLRELAFNLSEEFYHRYHNVHSSFYVIRELSLPNIPSKDITPAPQCMPSQYKCDDLVIVYRNYYIGEKSRFARWTKRPVPEWFNYNGILIPNGNKHN